MHEHETLYSESEPFGYSVLNAHFERVAPFGFTIYHLHDFFVDLLARSIALSPNVTSATSIFRDKDIFWVVKVRIRRGEDGIDDLMNTKVNLNLYWLTDAPTRGSKSTRIARGM
jgi:hypothetical protein